MNKFRKYILFLLIPFHGWSQNCDISIHGRALDEVTGNALAFATIFLESSGTATQADEDGYFELNKLCPDSTHIRISHVSCEPLLQFLIIRKDTVLYLYLHHHEELMDEVEVHGKKSETGTESSATLDSDLISRQSNKDLANLLAGIAGVSQLKTGSGIAKPVVHGLYGNRIALLNNGISQGGQQWGNDHAPEIDAYAADHISVVKGVGALAYAGQSLGGVVLIEPADTEDDPHFHGGLNYIYQSNGRGNTINAKLEKGGTDRAFWIKGTLKRHGDLQAPHYFLTNTGKKEADVAIKFESGKSEKWRKSLYFSSFNTELGILRGSHIGNLTDLEQAIGRTVPFFTEDNFSYAINSPAQQVNHQLLKLGLVGEPGNDQIIHLNYGVQLNARKEFDVRRGGRSDEAALSLRQWTQQLDFSYEKSFSKGAYLKTGLLGQYIDNTNVPGTGILPLIPDYVQYSEGAYLIFQKEMNKWTTEAGGRLNFAQYQVLNISRDLPRRVERHHHDYQNASLSLGAKWEPSKKLKISLNGGYAGRPPAVNELYSYGLHQGVSSLEIGSPDLKPEHSLKSTLSIDLRPGEHFFLQVLGYYQQIRNYIFLKPSPEPELTIRGAFPVFYYSQTDAEIRGVDLLLSFEPVDAVRIISKAGLLKGDDRRNGIPLVYMPSNNLNNRIEIGLKGNSKLEQPRLAVELRSVFKQAHLNPDQDFLPPPPAYHVLNVEANTGLQLGKRHFQLGLHINNALNTVYRDYLNRQRYFSDEMGRSINLRFNWDF